MKIKVSKSISNWSRGQHRRRYMVLTYGRVRYQLYEVVFGGASIGDRMLDTIIPGKRFFTNMPKKTNAEEQYLQEQILFLYCAPEMQSILNDKVISTVQLK